MNKTLLTTCALAVMATASMAQNKGLVNSSPNGHGPTLPTGSDKTTATRWRINGYTTEGHDGATFIRRDSVRFTNSGNKGPLIIIDSRQFVFNETPDLDYDQQLGFTWNPGTTSYDVKLKGVQTFDANGNILETLNQTWDAGSSSWENESKTISTYDGNNNRTSQIYQNWNNGTTSWDNSSKYTYNYNTSNQKTDEIYQNWTSGAWANSSKNIYTYGTGGRLETDIYQQWNGSAWQNSDKDQYNYTGANTMPDDRINQDWVSGAWKNDEKTTYAYSSPSDLTSATIQHWDNGSSVWENYSKSLITTNPNHGITEVISQEWDAGAWKNTGKNMYGYLTGGTLINTLVTQRWNAGGFWEYTTNDFKQTLTYENYEVPENINDVNSLAGQLSLFPNPAAANLNVRMEWNKMPATITGTIYTADGRMAQRWNEPAKTNTYNTAVNVSSLPAGSYYIVLQGDGARATQQFSVVK